MPATSRPYWAPFELSILDCDSTLSTIEGIDELARWQGRTQQVAELTNRAMNGDVTAEGKLGEGARFTLTLPRANARAAPFSERETPIASASELASSD